MDAAGDVWTYRPPHHKTEYRGHVRVLKLGPKAQKALRPWLKPDPQAFIFCPADVAATQRQARHKIRRTPDGQGNEIGTNRKTHPKRNPGRRYTHRSYSRAIARACDKAFPAPAHLARLRIGKRRETKSEWQSRLGTEKWKELKVWRDAHRWHPHQLRHSAATQFRSEEDIEAAMMILGHRSRAVTEIYAKRDLKKVERTMERIG